jgi:hypothetical protein
MQKHSKKAVKHGTLSTLRQTISALLGKNMTQSECCINKFMDDNCLWEWDYTPNPCQIEKEELSSVEKCYPLNIKENHTVSKNVISKLKKLRKEFKNIIV